MSQEIVGRVSKSLICICNLTLNQRTQNQVHIFALTCIKKWFVQQKIKQEITVSKYFFIFF